MRRHLRSAAPKPAREVSREEKSLGAIVDEVVHSKSGVTIPIRLDKSTMTFGAFVAGVSLTEKDGEALRRQVVDAIEKSVRIDWIPLISIQQELEDRTTYSSAVEPDANEDLDTDGAINIRLNRFFVGLAGPDNWRSIAWNVGVDANPQTDKISASKQWSPPSPDDKAVEKLARKLQVAYEAESDKNTKLRPRHYSAFKEDAESQLADGFKLPYLDTLDPKERGRWDTQAKHYLAYDESLWLALTAIVSKVREVNSQLSKIIGTKKGLDAITQLGAGATRLLSAGNPGKE